MSACRDCGPEIAWHETDASRFQPIDPESGTVHFTTCPARWRPSLPPDVFLRCNSLNVEQEPGRGPHYALLRCLACGANRWLPWPERGAK